MKINKKISSFFFQLVEKVLVFPPISNIQTWRFLNSSFVCFAAGVFKNVSGNRCNPNTTQLTRIEESWKLLIPGTRLREASLWRLRTRRKIALWILRKFSASVVKVKNSTKSGLRLVQLGQVLQELIKSLQRDLRKGLDKWICGKHENFKENERAMNRNGSKP